MNASGPAFGGKAPQFGNGVDHPAIGVGEHVARVNKHRNQPGALRANHVGEVVVAHV